MADEPGMEMAAEHHFWISASEFEALKPLFRDTTPADPDWHTLWRGELKLTEQMSNRLVGLTAKHPRLALPVALLGCALEMIEQIGENVNDYEVEIGMGHMRFDTGIGYTLTIDINTAGHRESVERSLKDAIKRNPPPGTVH